RPGDGRSGLRFRAASLWREENTQHCMIIYQSRFLTRGEVWFDNAPGSERVDWVLYHQRSQPGMKGNWRPFYTRVIELSTPTDSLLAQMDGFTAADIRRARQKDNAICQKIET